MGFFELPERDRGPFVLPGKRTCTARQGQFQNAIAHLVLRHGFDVWISLITDFAFDFATFLFGATIAVSVKHEAMGRPRRNYFTAPFELPA
jgi:hypothetical protein